MTQRTCTTLLINIIFPDITINGLDIVDWDETYSVDLMNEGTVTSYDHSSARINLASDVQLEVTRSHTVNNETYLGFFITHGGGLGDGATGVIGQYKGCKIINSNHTINLKSCSAIPIGSPQLEINHFL